MRKFTETPPIAPTDRGQTVYLVADDMGETGQVWRQSECEHSDREAVIQDMLAGEYRNPIRVVAFNTTEHWCEDASADVAHELRRRCDLQLRDIPFFLQDFCDLYEGRYRDIQLPLPIGPS
jgi:hypothetical protein